MDRNPYRQTVPISEDADPIIRVEVIRDLTALPSWGPVQRWEFHHDRCPECSGGCFPCDAGGELAIAAENAVADMHDTARWN